MTELLEEYKLAVAHMAEMQSQVLAAFLALDSIEDRLNMVLEFGYDYLSKDNWYTGPDSADLPAGMDISLYDDLYWEKYETKDLDDWYSRITDDLVDLFGIKYEWSTVCHQRVVAENVDKVMALETPAAYVLRDFLKQGIGAADYNW